MTRYTKASVPDRYRKDVDQHPCDHCDFNERDLMVAEASMKAKKAERERVLDLIQDHNDGRLKGLEILFATPSNERTLSAQDVYLNEAYFELGLVKHLIESLREVKA